MTIDLTKHRLMHKKMEEAGSNTVAAMSGSRSPGHVLLKKKKKKKKMKAPLKLCIMIPLYQ